MLDDLQNAALVVQNRVYMCISLVFVPKLVFWYEYAKASLGTVFTRLGTPKASLGTKKTRLGIKS